MKRQFNKLGSIEIAENTFKYRMSIQDLGNDDPNELEREIKRKLSTLSDESMVLLPFSIEVINRYMVLYYDLTHFASIDYLRELDLQDKIPYYLSLVRLAQEQEKGMKLSWDRVNFVCDKHEVSVKAILFESGSIKIYDSPVDILKTTKDLICTTMTTLSRVITLPKRQDFISPSEENIHFVENLYRMDNLDDLYMYMETLEMELSEKPEDNFEEPITKKISKKPIKKSKIKNVKKVSRGNHSKDSGALKKKKENRNLAILVSAVVLVLVLYLVSTMLLPSDSEAGTKELVDTTNMNSDTMFKSTADDKKGIVEAYRNAYNSEYEKAFKSLSSMNVYDLDSADIPMLIQVYERTNNLSLLLDTAPSLANDIITYLLTKDKLSQLGEISEKMETKNPYIEFEKAHFNSEYEYMLTFIKDIEINGRKETQIMDAYLDLEMLDEARRFAEKVGNPDLIKRVEENRR